MRRSLAVVFPLFLLSSCFWNTNERPRERLEKKFAYKAVYAFDTSYRIISYASQPRPVVNAGKIYVKGNYIFQCETGEGIHVIDNTDPATASRIGFLAVKGAEEISIKDNYLFTNNYMDLVVINIADFTNPVVINRNKDAFNSGTSNKPHSWQQPPEAGYFECPRWHPDSVIVSWVKDSVYAQCFKD